MTHLGNFEAIAAWAAFGPHGGRPVQNIAVLAEGNRYAGFTSREHAQWFCERTGRPNAEIVEYPDGVSPSCYTSVGD